ncbi:MAG: TonB-dependent receptor [Proteobacteria bacterium]|nr:TonB-dependent receptor [Pseudomonadota bacterium]
MKWVIAVLGLFVALPAIAQEEEPEAADEAVEPTLVAPYLLGMVSMPLPEGLLEPGTKPYDVVLSLLIDVEGLVEDVQVKVSSGIPGLDDHALEAAFMLQFNPALLDGVPTQVTLDYPFRFFPPPPPPPLIPPAVLTGRVEVKGSREAAPNIDVELYSATPAPGYIEGKPEEGAVGEDGEPIREARGPKHYTLSEQPAAVVEADEEGSFVFPDLTAGTYVAVVGGGAFRIAKFVETFEQGQAREVLYRLLPTGLAETVVVERRDGGSPERVLTRDELWKMPGSGGDPVAAVAQLPGVSIAPSFALGAGEPAPVVRGAAQEDSVAILDGLPTPLLLHSLGQVSITGQFLVERAYLKPAAAEAEFGDLTGGVLGLDVRSPRSDRIGGFVQPGLGQSAIALEGPITEKARFYVGFKRSYFELLGALFIPKDAPIDFVTFPFYQDQQAILQWDLHPNLTVQLDYIGATDGIDLFSRPGEEDEDQSSDRIFKQQINMHRIQAKLKFNHPSGFTNVVHPAITFWGESIQILTFIETLDRHTTFHLRDRFHAPVLPWLTIDGGVFLEVDNNRLSTKTFAFAREDTGPQTSIGDEPDFDGSERTTRVWVGGWVGATFQPHEVISITPEFRLDYWGALGQVSPQVRGRIGFRPTPWMGWTLAGGRYEQRPSRDEINSVTGNPELDPEGAWHINLGTILDPAPWLMIDVQGFAKFADNTVVSEGGGDAFSDLFAGFDAGAEDDEDPTHGLSNSGAGRIYGAEVFSRFGTTKKVGLAGWLGYSLAWAERKDFPDEDWRYFQWDRRHQLTVLMQIKLPLEMQFGAKFIIQSGAPFTEVEGATFYADAGAFIPTYGEQYGARAKPYHQLDLRFDKRFRAKKYFVDFFVDVTNVYYAQTAAFTIYSFDYRETAGFSQFPAIDVGVRIEF